MRALLFENPLGLLKHGFIYIAVFLSKIFHVKHRVKIREQYLRFPRLEGHTAHQVWGGYEMEVYDFISTIPRGAVLFDFGASLGNFALYAAGRGIDTYAFEPEDENFAALEENARANSFAGLHLYKLAVSDGQSSQGVLMKNDRYGAGDHIKILRVNEFSATPVLSEMVNAEQVVKTVSLDQLIMDYGLPVPDYLKIDVDGSEVAFMKGAKNTLANQKVRGIIFELFKDNSYYENIVAELKGYGFTIKEEHQVSSMGRKDVGLFNMEFVRTI